ncbi:MAG: DUF1294 domain-containing protein [Pseudomonadota bacterium]
MIPALLLAWLIVVNLLGGAIFVADKRAAVADRRRVPERTLLALAAAGASPAMLVLSSKIRHKTRKQPFRGLLFAIVAVQVVAIVVLARALVTGLV